MRSGNQSLMRLPPTADRWDWRAFLSALLKALGTPSA
jgi:hypothetical protein